MIYFVESSGDNGSIRLILQLNDFDNELNPAVCIVYSQYQSRSRTNKLTNFRFQRW